MEKNLSTAEIFKKLKSSYGYEKGSVDNPKNRTSVSSESERPGSSNKESTKGHFSTRKRIDSSESMDSVAQNKSYMIPPKKTSVENSSPYAGESSIEHTWVKRRDEVSKKLREIESTDPQKTAVPKPLIDDSFQNRHSRNELNRNRLDSSVHERNESFLIPPKKSSPGHSFGEEPKGQMWVKKPDEIDYKIKSQTESSLQVLPNKKHTFESPKYSPKKPDEINKLGIDSSDRIKSILERLCPKNSVAEELTKEQMWVKKVDEFDYKIKSRTESSLQVLPNKMHNFYSIGPKCSQKKCDEINNSGHRLEKFSAESSVGEDSVDQIWVEKPDKADFKISSKTESLFQVLPNKAQGLDFIGPKYSPIKTPECVENTDLDETEEPSNEEIAPHLEFIDCDQILCERTESNNPFRVIFGNISIRTSIDDSKLNGLINKMKSFKNLFEVSLTQTWAIAKVFEGENVIFVDTPSLNTSSTYFIPMIAKTTKNDKLYGPSNIILAANVQMVAKLERVIKRFSNDKLCTVSYYGDDLDLSLEEKFALCDFVISTPKYFSKLLDTMEPTRLSKLNCVAFDSIHNMNDFSHEEFVELIRSFEKLTQHETSKKGPNIVVTTEFWNQKLETITQATLISPILFLACPLQAAICSNIKLYLKVLENDNQKLKLCAAILKKTNFSKRIILCANTKELAAIESYLKMFTNVVTITENLEREAITQSTGKEPLTILCMEGMLSSLKINDADCLIVFSLFPSLKASFSIFHSHLTKESCQRCGCYIFIDEKSDFKLTNMISNLNVEKPIKLEQILKSAKEAYEMSKLDVPFCEKLIQFGKCSMELLCPKRHILDANRDGNKTRLNKKRVLLDIVNVYDATHYYGKVACVLNGDQLTESDMKVFTDYRENLRSLGHFLRKLGERPKIGDQIIVPTETDVMERGEIVRILRRDQNLVPIAVSVFTESGHIIHHNVDELYELPQIFKNLPVESVNIILGDIVPSDSNGIWSPNVTAIAQNSLINENSGGPHKTFFSGNIKLVIGNTIVVDDIICHEKGNGFELTQKFSMSQKLLTLKYAQHDRNVTKILIDSCIKAGLKIGLDNSPISSSEEVEIKKSPKKEDIKDSLVPKMEALSLYLDDALPHTQADTVSSSNFENEETKNVTSTFQEASNFLDEKTENVEVAPEVLNLENEETENALDNSVEKYTTPIETPSEDDDLSEDYDFNTSSVAFQNYVHHFRNYLDGDKNLDFQSLFMKMFDETIKEFNGSDELCQFPLKAESSNKNLSDDLEVKEITVKNVSDVLASEKLDDSYSSNIETEIIQYDQKNVSDCDLMSEIYKEFMQQSKTESSQISLNEKNLPKTPRTDKLNFEESLNSESPESDFNARKEQKCNIESENEFEDKSLKTMPEDESEENSQNEQLQSIKNDVNNKQEKGQTSEVPAEPTQELEYKDFTAVKNEVEAKHEKTHESNIIADKNEVQQTDEPTVPYLSPKVYWRQKGDLIWARIMILDVEDYKLSCAKNYFTFRADVNDKVYFLTILTFSPIVPESLTCNVTGQCVEVRFEAAFKGFDWPRLTYFDNGGSQIKRDPDCFEQDDDTSLPLCEQIFQLGEKRRKLKEEFGIIEEKTEDKFGYVPEAPGAPPDCDLESESDDSDSHIIDPNDTPSDLLDFF